MPGTNASENARANIAQHFKGVTNDYKTKYL